MNVNADVNLAKIKIAIIALVRTASVKIANVKNN